MRTFRYIEPDWDSPTLEPITITRTEAEILVEYYPYWRSQMLRVGKADLVNDANCIDDWIVVNCAEEVR